ncbi:MAG: DUF1566 domain-containing protein [Pseudomonadales bacterium]|nr:DUF1566 domain-containing protein [Pseudomonadales bacterium]
MMKNKLLQVFSATALLLLLAACSGDGGMYGTGGGAGGGGHQNSPYEGQVLLGPVINANVTVSLLFADEQKPLCQMLSRESVQLNIAGTFSINASCIPDNNQLFVITASGGLDIDIEDDGIVDTQPSEVDEAIHTVVIGSQLYRTPNWKVSRLTDDIYRYVIYAKQELDLNADQIRLALELLSEYRLHHDVSEDNTLSYQDILSWHPRFDRSALISEPTLSIEAFFESIWEQLEAAGTGKPNSVNHRLNDTGIILCGDYAYDYDAVIASNNHHNNLDCAATGATAETDGTDADGDIVLAAQDAINGRDHSHPDNSDGHAGFSYTKLDSNGNPLDVSAPTWSCVKDNVTGLIWEVKTDANSISGESLHDADDSYLWYNSDSMNNGGANGNVDGSSDNCHGYQSANFNSSYDADDCNTLAYVERVNNAGWCGAKDWRLPNKQELQSIVNNNRTNAAVDSNFFPNTQDYYWTATAFAPNTVAAWRVNFNVGDIKASSKSNYHYLRLVRNTAQ